jgi:hypothetical protein
MKKILNVKPINLEEGVKRFLNYLQNKNVWIQ